MDCNTLFDAAFKDDADAIFQAVEAGADPNICHPRGGHTPLQVAAQRRAPKAVEALLRVGADPNLRFNWQSRVDGREFVGRTALMYASTAGIARALLNAGADLNATDGSGWNALVRAVDSVNLEVFHELVAAGADASIEFEYNSKKCNLIEFVNEKRSGLGQMAKEDRSEAMNTILRALDLMCDRLVATHETGAPIERLN